MPAEIAKNYFYQGAGQVFLGERREDGSPDCLHAIGNVPAANLAFAITSTDHLTSQDCSKGVDYTNIDEVTGTLSLTLESLNSANLALAMYGTDTTVAAGAGATQDVIFHKLGCWYPLDTIALTEGSVALGTLVEGTDFDVDYVSGMIRMIDGGAGTAGDTETLTFDFAEQHLIQGLTQTAAPERYVRIAGLNCAASGAPSVIDVFKVGVQPLTTLPIFGQALAQMPLELKVLADTTRTTGSQFFRVLRRDVATT